MLSRFAPTARRLGARSVHIEKKLEDLGISLPPVNPPVANYRLVTRSGNLLFTGPAPCRTRRMSPPSADVMRIAV